MNDQRTEDLQHEVETLRHLLRQFALFASGMTREVERDMQRVITLSDEAINDVGANFVQIGALASRLRDILKNSKGSDESERMDRALLLAEIKTETDSATRNLQHQDIISQVLTASRKQLDKLEQNAKEVYDAVASDQPLDPAVVERLDQDLKALIEAISSGKAHPVAQRSMQAGSVDLF